MTVAATKITIKGLAPSALDVQARQAFRIPFVRGTEPGTFDLILDAEAVAKLRKNVVAAEPVSFEITVADSRGAARKLTVRNWYVQRVKQVSESGWAVTFADLRWKLGYTKLTAAYNIKTYGGRWREGTTPGPSTAWECIGALDDALRKMDPALTVVVDGPLANRTANLPENLGNSKGGIWHNARLAEFVPLFLEPVRADLTVTPEGELLITDRETQPAASILSAAFNNGLGETDRSWQRPKKIRVSFRMRSERRFDIGVSTATSEEVQTVNVAEDFDPDDPTVTPDPPYPPLTDLLSRELGLTLNQLEERFLKPALVPITAASTAAQIYRQSAFEQIIRRAWRRVWQVNEGPTGNANSSRPRARIADMQFGRLRADGTTEPKGVYVHWVERRRVALNGTGDTPQWAINHPPGGGDEPGIAPFRAKWLDESARVFVIEDEPLPLFVSAAHIGRLDAMRMPRLVPIAALKDKTTKIQFEENGVFKDRYRGYVYYHALLVGEAPATFVSDPALAGPVYYEEVDGFSEGGIESVTVPVEDMTANFRFAFAPGFSTPLWPGEWLNRDAVKTHAERIADRVKQSYADGKAGVVRCAGVEAALSAGMTKGAVHWSAIVIGEDAPWSVTTIHEVIPEIRSTAKPELAAFDPRELL